MGASTSTPNVAPPGGGSVVDTEFSPAVAAADDMGNPTAPQVLTYGLIFDGTTWDRIREATADNMPATGIPASGTMVFDGATWDRWTGTVSATQSGTWVVDLSAATLAALETITVLQGTSPWIVSGTVTADTNFDYPEDSVHASGDAGAFVLAVRNDAGTALAADGDYTPLQTNAAGELRVTTSGGTPTGRDDTDNQAAVATGLTTTVVRNYIWDGTNWDRWTGAVTQGTSPWVVSGTVEIGATSLAALESITVQNPGGASAVNIQDGGNSITVDSVDLDIRNLTFAQDKVDASGSVVALDAPTLTALESITVQNGAGAAAVNIQDGGNSITVDGAVTVSGTVTADTELPAASALADADPNPTTSRIGANGLVFNGTTWDRVRAASSDAMAATGLQADGNMVFNGTAWDRWKSPNADALTNATGLGSSAGLVFNGTTWDRIRSAGTTGSQMVGGTVAHDSPVAGNPILTGATAAAENTTVTSVTAGDVVRLLADLKGVLYTQERRNQQLGIYYAGSGPHVYGAAADAATAGRIWLVNTSSTIAIALREIRFTTTNGSALVTLTEPRINVERMTFTGTPSGAQITPGKRDSTDPTATGSLRTAVTGMTPTAGATLRNFAPTSALTGIGINMPTEQVWTLQVHIDSRVVLRQNEGLVIRQADAGTTADTRVFFLDFAWEEYTL